MPLLKVTDELFELIKRWRDDDDMTWTAIAGLLNVADTTVSKAYAAGRPSTRKKKIKPPPPQTKSARMLKRRRAALAKLANEETTVTTLVVGKRKKGATGKRRGPKPKARVTIVRKYPTVPALVGALKDKNKDFALSNSQVRRELKMLKFVARKRGTAPQQMEGDPEVRLDFCREQLYRAFGRDDRDVKTDPDDSKYDDDVAAKDPQRFRRIRFSDEFWATREENGGDSRYNWVHANGPPVRPIAGVQQEEKHGFWGIIGVGFRKLIYFKEGPNPNQAAYVKMLETVNKEALQWVNEDDEVEVLFMQDGAGVHGKTENSAPQVWMRKKHVDYVPNWPPRSPDLNPIERLWAIVKPRVAARRPADPQQMETFMQEEFDNVPQQTIDALVLSWETRLRACIAAGGQIIKP